MYLVQMLAQLPKISNLRHYCDYFEYEKCITKGTTEIFFGEIRGKLLLKRTSP